MWMELQRGNPRPSSMGGVIKNAEGAIVTIFSRQPVLGDSNRQRFFQLGRARAHIVLFEGLVSELEGDLINAISCKSEAD